jgi:hypothetical protein
MKLTHLRSVGWALLLLAGAAVSAAVSAQTLTGTSVTSRYASFPTPYPAHTVASGSAVEFPSAGLLAPHPGLGTKRWDIDYDANTIRINFIDMPATYGGGAAWTFDVRPICKLASGQSVPTTVTSISATTNKADAASYVTAQSSFTANSVRLPFTNYHGAPNAPGNYSDWKPGDYILATLKFAPCSGGVVMPPHDVTVLTPGPVNACRPYELCFDVNVPTGPLPGKSDLSLQLYQNGNPVGLPLTHTMTADGKWCFQMPAIAQGQGFDYVLTTTHTYGFPFNANSVVLTDIEIDALPKLGTPGVHQGQQQGLNNDLVCAGAPASTCCPPVNHDMVAGMFDDNASNSGAAYFESLQVGSPAALSFVNGLNAYLSYLKFICPQTTNLKAEFFTGPVTAPTTVGGPAGLLTLTTPIATYTTGGNLAVSLAPLSTLSRNQGQYYRTSVKVTGVNSAGATVNCGFDATACALDDTYAFMHNSTAKMAPGFSPRTR